MQHQHALRDLSKPHKIRFPSLFKVFLHLHLIDRKLIITLNSMYQNTNLRHKLPFYKAPRHASVGRRGEHTKKLHSNNNHNHTKCINSHKITYLTSDINYRKTMTSQGKGAARDLTEDPNFAMLEADSPPQGHKRNNSTKALSEEKKSRATSSEKRKVAAKEKLQPPPHFWLGFEAMEKLTIEEGTPLVPEPTPNNVRKVRSDKEAAELTTAVVSYPHVHQTLFPIVRTDGIEGQHFNLTQLPFEVETDPDTRLSYDYQVAIYFKKPTKQYTHEEMLALTQARLREMRIALGTKIAEPIAILCKNGSARHWS